MYQRQPHTQTRAPQRAHIVAVGDIILVEDVDLRRSFGAERLSVASVNGNWAWAGDQGQWGFTTQRLRDLLDAGKVTLACVPALTPDPDGEEGERRLAEGRCLTCGARGEDVKWLPTMDGPIPVCAQHVAEMAASYAALEEDDEEA